MVEQAEVLGINSIRYTADRAHVIATTTKGFKIVKVADGQTVKTCSGFEGGLQICAPLGRTSIFLIVGTGKGADELRT